MDLSKLRSTTPKGRPAPLPVRPAPVATPAAKKEQPVTNAASVPPPGRTQQYIASVQRPNPNASVNGTRLSDMIERMIEAAWSEQLPADYPSSISRSLDVRRRGYVYVGVVQYVTHNLPYMNDVDGAIVQGTNLARTLMNAHQDKIDGRVRALNGLPPSPSRVEAEAQAPVYNTKLAAAVEAQMVRLIAAGKQYTDEVLEKDKASEKKHLSTAAAEYLLRYTSTGDARADGFMASVRSKLDVRPQFRVASLTHRQARAVLNIWLAALKASRPAS